MKIISRETLKNYIIPKITLQKEDFFNLSIYILKTPNGDNIINRYISQNNRFIK